MLPCLLDIDLFGFITLSLAVTLPKGLKVMESEIWINFLPQFSADQVKVWICC